MIKLQMVVYMSWVLLKHYHYKIFWWLYYRSIAYHSGSLFKFLLEWGLGNLFRMKTSLTLQLKVWNINCWLLTKFTTSLSSTCRTLLIGPSNQPKSTPMKKFHTIDLLLSISVISELLVALNLSSNEFILTCKLICT